MKWRSFKMREIREAKAWARDGGIAVHISGFQFKGKDTAHLLAPDEEALLAAAKVLKLKTVWIQRPPKASVLHFDIFGVPLQRALALCVIENDKES